MSPWKPFLAVSFALPLLACCAKENARSAAPAPQASPQPVEARPIGLDGQPAPDFEVESLDGAKTRLASLKGKVVLLDFWATWCEPCRVGLPHTAKLAKDYRSEELAVLAITDEDKPTIEAFLREMRLELPVFRDPDGDSFRAFSVMALPTVVVIGRDGTVVSTLVGLPEPREVASALKEAGLEFSK